MSLKTSKWQFLEFLESFKLISRKIWVAGRLRNFHTVWINEKYTFAKKIRQINSTLISRNFCNCRIYWSWWWWSIDEKIKRISRSCGTFWRSWQSSPGRFDCFVTIVWRGSTYWWKRQNYWMQKGKQIADFVNKQLIQFFSFLLHKITLILFHIFFCEIMIR